MCVAGCGTDGAASASRRSEVGSSGQMELGTRGFETLSCLFLELVSIIF